METTSILAFKRAMGSGLIKKQQLSMMMLYCEIWNKNSSSREIGVTANESIAFAKQYNSEILNLVSSHNHLNKFQSALLKKGFLEYIGDRECIIKNTPAKAYKLSFGHGHKPIKKKSKDQIIKELRLEIKELKNGIRTSA